MRVLVAPDSFGGTLSAPDAAAAIAEGWRRAAPADRVRQLPLADGGSGFVDVLHTLLGGELHRSSVAGPLPGQRVTAGWLRVGDTAYVEAAQACGLHLVGRVDATSARVACSRGVGELVAAAAGTDGIATVVVGLGGTASTDGGAGALAVLGAGPLDAAGDPLPDGGAALDGCARLCGVPGLRNPVKLVIASDVDNPLLGRHGAAAVFSPQKGADPAAVADLERGLTRWAEALDIALGRPTGQLAATPGAGAAGGLGAGLLACGGRRVSGAGLVRQLSGLDAALETADLVITGEGSFDWQSLRGKLVSAVAEAASARGLPCLVLAGQVSVGRREAGAIGVEDAYAVAEHAGGVAAALAEPGPALAALAADVAAQWSGSR
jgi:glycerate kinase